MVALSSDLQQQIDAVGTPLRLVDPRTGKEYMLVESFKSAVGTSDLADTYRAQVETALRAGWDDPAMDEYNDYDRHRNP